jgi:hypothetical protein
MACSRVNFTFTYLTVNTHHVLYKDQSVNAVHGNNQLLIVSGAWGSVVVKALRY